MTCDAQQSRDRTCERASSTDKPSAWAVFERIKLLARTGFDPDALENLEKRSSHSKSLQGAAFAMPKQLEHADRCAQTGGSKVQGQVVDVSVRHRNGRGADEHSRVIGERQAQRERCGLSPVFQNPQWQSGTVPFAQMSRKCGGDRARGK